MKKSFVGLIVILVALLFVIPAYADVTYPPEFNWYLNQENAIVNQTNVIGYTFDWAGGYGDLSGDAGHLIFLEMERQTILLEKQNELLDKQNHLLEKIAGNDGNEVICGNISNMSYIPFSASGDS